MRRYIKASESNFNFFISNVKNKIIKFKATKWKKINKKINIITKIIFLKYKNYHNKNFKRYYFKFFNIKIKNLKYINKKKKNLLKLFLNFNFNKNICNFYRINRNRFFFKEKLFIKKNYTTFFDGGFNWKFYKKTLLKNKFRIYLVNKFFIHPEYRIDIVLWKTFFFLNIYEAEKAIMRGQVLNNNKKIYLKYFIKEGDILEIKNKFLFLNYSKIFFIPRLIFSHLQIDYYSNLIIVLQNWNDYNFINWKSVINIPLSLTKIKHLFLI